MIWELSSASRRPPHVHPKWLLQLRIPALRPLMLMPPGRAKKSVARCNNLASL